MSPKPQVPNDKINFSDAKEMLEKLACLKSPGLDWNISRYAKQRRSQGPDRAGLVVYKELLGVLVTFAPACQPGIAQMRDCWLELLKKYQIMDMDLVKAHKDIVTWADECAGKARLMLKHLMALKVSGSKYIPMELQPLLQQVHIPDGVAASTPAPQRALARHLSHNVSCGSSVHFCVVFCKSPDYYVPPPCRHRC